MIHVGVHGASGKMGERIIALLKAAQATDHTDLTLSAAYVPADSSIKGKKCTESVKYEVLSTDSIKKIDVMIDFSQPNATLETLPILRELRKPVVIGTTGFTDAQRKEIEAFSKNVPVVLAPNTSIGMNVLYQLAQKAAYLLPEDFTPHISETHHTQKTDAPSGSARQLKREIEVGRPNTDIATESIRAGDVVGEHTVTFYGFGERIEITHRAGSRDIFAKGALKAAHWIVNQRPQLYSMQHVLKGTH